MKRRRGSADQKVRRALAPAVEAGDAKCWRCGEPILPGEPWDAGHVVAIAEGGHPDGKRLPEHRGRCNRRDGARIAAERRRGVPSRSRSWL